MTTALVVLFLVVLADVRRKDLERVATNEETILEGLSRMGMDFVRVRSPEGRITVHLRNPGETDQAFVARVDLEVNGGGLLSPLCETLHCTSGTVQVCVACMPGESMAACQARLDALVAAWCATHTCDECP